MDKNQRAAIIALIAVVLLIALAIGIIVYEVRTVGLPSISLPSFSWPQKSEPDETFEPFNTPRSEEHTSELQSPDNISYAVFCL